MIYLRSLVDHFRAPAKRLTEVLFGLIMVLTCTLGAALTVEEGREATYEMLFAALGCNVAWGFINAVIYLMDAMFERGQTARLVDSVRSADSEPVALSLIEDALDPVLAGIIPTEERERLYHEVFRKIANASPAPMRIYANDLAGATVTCVVMFLTALPVFVPFLLFSDLLFALRVSNTLVVGILFLVGYRWGRETGVRPWLAGVAISLVGIALVVVAKTLGG
jgi:hypothetical protein